MAAGNICYYKKFGHCKFLDTCIYRHVETICEKENCEIDNCERRHPKECRYYKEFSRCKFGDYCSFRHESTITEGNVKLVKEVETLKERVELLEKLIEDKDKEIKEIRKDLANLVKNEDKNFTQPLVTDEILLESLIERAKVIEPEKDKAVPNISSETTLVRPVINPLTYQCDKCYEIFSIKSDLLNHNKTNHEPVKYPCDICWNIFETERGMKNHVRRVHQPD